MMTLFSEYATLWNVLFVPFGQKILFEKVKKKNIPTYYLKTKLSQSFRGDLYFVGKVWKHKIILYFIIKCC